ncbi:MAG: acyl carrier protein [Clostridiales bacterium]|nr:acyl carrier protein [Clostridiales bacterium]
MTIAEFNHKVTEIIGKSLEMTDSSAILPDSRLQQDLGMSSLTILTMVAQLEDEFNVRIPARALARIVTVQDLQEYILKNIL